MKRKAITIGLLALAIAGGARANTLVYCSEGSPEGFNPQLFTSGTTVDASSAAIYNRLVDFKPGTVELQPSLAESWEVSEDGKRYTFHLRKGVAFQSNKYFTPTRDFNADDVIFSFMRQKDANNPYHKVSNGAYTNFESMEFGTLIDRIVKVDDHTVRFELSRAEAPFVADLGMYFATLLSAEYADAMLKAGTPQRVDNDPIGTGPFQLVQYQKDAKILYKAFDRYWEGKPKIDRLVFSITPRLLLVVAGDQPMLWQRFQIGRQAIAGDVGGAGAHYPALGGDAAGVQRAVLLLADADGGVEPFLRRIGQAFGQIEVDPQLRVAFRQRRQQRQHIGFAERWQAADAQRALRRFVQRAQLGAKAGNVRHQRGGARQQQLAGVGQQQATGGAHEQCGAERAFQGVDVAHQRGGHHAQPARGGGKAAQAGHVEKNWQMFYIAGVIHFCIICKSVSYEYPLLCRRRGGYSGCGLTTGFNAALSRPYREKTHKPRGA